MSQQDFLESTFQKSVMRRTRSCVMWGRISMTWRRRWIILWVQTSPTNKCIHQSDCPFCGSLMSDLVICKHRIEYGRAWHNTKLKFTLVKSCLSRVPGQVMLVDKWNKLALLHTCQHPRLAMDLGHFQCPNTKWKLSPKSLIWCMRLQFKTFGNNILS